MEFITRECPKCKGELKIPSNLKVCICMYCGETFNLEEDKPAEVSTEVVQSREKDYRAAFEGISGLLDGYEKLLTEFTRTAYHNGFERYEQTGISILMPIERYASLPGQDPEKIAEEAARRLIDTIDLSIQGTKNTVMGPAKDRLQDRYRFFLTVYTVPMILHLKYSISEPLADSMIAQWCSRHPKFQFKKAEFELLESGFKRRGFCFITSAVCETLDKEDDCMELTTLRNFRDHYMRKTPEGQALIDEYYEIAPAIVTYLNLSADKKEKFMGIWREYLKPCISDMEEGKPECCQERYVHMVQKLRREMPYEL